MEYRAEEAIQQLLKHYKFETVLDIGCGHCNHTNTFLEAGKTVTSTDLFQFTDIPVVQGDYANLKFEPHDITWVSHVLEHQLNVNLFLRKVRKETKVGGYICVTVPPLKHQIVGGHVTLWNAGLLLYNLVLAGFNCRDAAVKTYGYNITVIARAEKFDLPANLHYDQGDIEKLKPWLPEFARQGFNGQIQELNWK